jgi:hypothetical protein
MKRLFESVLFLNLISPSGRMSAKTPVQNRTDLWGELPAGPYKVGCKLIYEIDRSRTWRTTRTYEQSLSADQGGRPIRISVWYPASRQGAGDR